MDHFLYEMLITTLVLRGCFYQLQQLLQYHAVEDSKPLACLLLSLQVRRRRQDGRLVRGVHEVQYRVA